MFNGFLESSINNKKVIYLYLNNRFEISNDMYMVKNNDLIKNQARTYLKNMNINFKGKDIYLVSNEIIVAKLKNIPLKNKFNYLEYIRFGKRGIEEILETEAHPSLKLIDINSDGIIETIKMNNYLLNVIITEMPNVMEIEALKAEAIIARSNAIKRIENKQDVKIINKLQIYKTKEELKSVLVGNYKDYINLVKKAIMQTDKIVIKYKNNIIDAYTHYRNSGQTEDSRNVLEKFYPYLVSVKSPDLIDKYLLRYKKISNKHLSMLLDTEINKDTSVEIIEKTAGNNTKLIKFNDKIYDGFTIAKRLSLISYDFFVDINDTYTYFVTRGSGINIGLSKLGAVELAKKGYSYETILSHYFPNTYLSYIKD